MKLIIDIPNEMYERIAVAPRCAGYLDAFNDRDMFVKAIQQGTPLSEQQYTMTNKHLIESLDLLAPKNPKSDYGKIQRRTVNEAIKRIKLLDKEQ